MPVMTFSADDVLGRAIEVENKACAFYRSAAENVENEEMQGLFGYLSDMEKEHSRIFRELREGLSEDEKKVQPLDPGNEMFYYLEGMQDLHAWESKIAERFGIKTPENAKDILQIALNAEKETVYFYTFLKDYVPEGQGRTKVETIIREEMRHAGILQKNLKAMK
ncbi:MAG: hypothetical protein GF401_16440 [Chitinivibrionales bacterium]|nr:hypothetical protein [Chitinivibrionales bacterium]